MDMLIIYLFFVVVAFTIVLMALPTIIARHRK